MNRSPGYIEIPVDTSFLFESVFSFLFASNVTNWIMEIQESSLPGFYCSRIFGLAPYVIRKGKNKHRNDEIQRSNWLCIYSIFIMIATGKFHWIPTLQMFRLVIELRFFIQFHFYSTKKITVTLTVRFIFVDAASKTPIRWVLYLFYLV